ncbi:MAG: hypothetical protein SFU86_05990, partial [Pirellulaceae bacterium]|nr:hypothetical protein [Pirellulaceae bacterium]
MFFKKSRLRRKGRPLGIERLETREVLAGNLAVDVTNGVLTIDGDNNDNTVQISYVNNNLQVQGTGGFGTGSSITTINGLAQPFTRSVVLRQVVINLRDGSDSVIITNDAFRANIINATDHLIRNSDALQSSTQATFGGSLDMNLGAGNDKALLNVRFSSSIIINGGGGLDEISLQGSRADTSIIIQDTTDAFPTEVYLYSVITDVLTINTGAGDDIVALRADSDIRRNLNINTNAGADLVRLGSLAQNEPRLDLRANTVINTAPLPVLTAADGGDTVEFFFMAMTSTNAAITLQTGL